MQRIERFFGFRVSIDDYVEPSGFDSLTREARSIAIQLALDPDEYYVYVHALAIEPRNEHFDSGDLGERLRELRISFELNQKQVKTGEILFFNKHFGRSLDPDLVSSATSKNVAYYPNADYLVRNRGLTTHLITFVSRSLRPKYRKVKVRVTAYPTKSYSDRLRSRHRSNVTKLDLYYSKSITLTLSRDYRARKGVQNTRFVWKGPDTLADLHSYLPSSEALLEVGDVKLMLERSKGVCRVEIPKGRVLGTGFLVAPGLVLTNHHVLRAANSDISQAAQEIALRFGAISDENGNETPGQVFELDKHQPILTYSDTNELDFVLLKCEAKLVDQHELAVLPYSLSIPAVKSRLTIIQHPVFSDVTNTMKFAPNPNGITGVYEDEGKIQYVTYASYGSSGSPCFDSHWRVVAMHRAERTVGFTRRREGVMFASMFVKIRDYLERRSNAQANSN